MEGTECCIWVYFNALLNSQDYQLWKNGIHCKGKYYRALFEIHTKFEILLSKQVGRRASKWLLNMSILFWGEFNAMKFQPVFFKNWTHLLHLGLVLYSNSPLTQEQYPLTGLKPWLQLFIIYIHNIYSYYGICGKTAAWIKVFLGNRSQVVSVNGTHSSPRPVPSAVPQGSVPWPVLSLLCVNEITDHIQSTMRLFADDSIVYREIKTTCDHALLQ